MQVPEIVAMIALATKGTTLPTMSPTAMSFGWSFGRAQHEVLCHVSSDTVLSMSPTAMSLGWSFGRAQPEVLCHVSRLSCLTSDGQFTGMGTYIDQNLAD